MIRILYGSAEFSAFGILSGTVLRNGIPLAGTVSAEEWNAESPVHVGAGDVLEFR